VLTWGVTTSLSMMSVVLSGWTPEAGWGSARVAEMTGHEVVITDPLAGMVSLMRGGSPSNCRLKRVVQLAAFPVLPGFAVADGAARVWFPCFPFYSRI
jgi:hypothetical protein